MKLSFEFYDHPTLEVAKNLLGKILVLNRNNTILKARIVETEAYTGEFDKGSHTYNNRYTDRTKIMYERAGHIYVYMIYGMYFMLNVVTGKIGKGEAVLIRAVEPVENLDGFSINRYGKKYSQLSSYQKKNITNGPGKLCKAYNITKSDNAMDLLSDEMYIEDNGYEEFEITTTTRIGIDYAEEATEFMYRFYITDNPYVSVTD